MGIRLASAAVGRTDAVGAVRVSACVAAVVVGVPVREGLLVECDLFKGCVRTGEPGEGSEGLSKYYR